jgi:hypothetical protein
MEERNEEFKAESRIVDDAEMTKKKYKQFMKDEESMSDDEASQNFDAEYDRQETKLENHRGRQVVVVKEVNARLRTEEGIRKSRVRITRSGDQSRARSSTDAFGHTYVLSWEC